MSLVTTAMDQRARSCWQSLRQSMVLPEPTGPPMPMRGGRDIFWILDSGFWIFDSGDEHSRVGVFVAGGGDVEPRVKPADFVERHGLGGGDHRGRGGERLGEERLARVLAEPEELH